MAPMQYDNFDLEITQIEGGYRVESDSPVGQAQSSFTLPFSEAELADMLPQLSQIDSTRNALGKSFGARLFDAVFDGDVRACLRSSIDEVESKGMGLRIRIRLNAAPALANLPWEYLYYPALGQYLSLSTQTPLVRYLELPERTRPIALTPPLRVLAVISSPNDQPALDKKAEWAQHAKAMRELEERGLLQLHHIPASIAALQDELRVGSYHLLYFLGHGVFDEASQQGLLLFENQQGQSDCVSGEELGILLHDHSSLRLVVLNACDGARTSRADLFAGVAQSLVRQGLPAVIAMQNTVTCEAVAILARAFCGALADGYPVDAALTEGRKALFAQGNHEEWSTPVLYMRAPEGRLFDVTSAKTEVRTGNHRRGAPVGQAVLRPMSHLARCKSPCCQ